MTRRWLTGFCGALAAACAAGAPALGPERRSAPRVGESAGCVAARQQVVSAEALVSEGRLRRARRALESARATCPRLEVTRATLQAIADELAQPVADPTALARRGIAEKKAGRRAEGQRMLDSALSALERVRNSPVRLVLAPRVLGAVPHEAWLAGDDDLIATLVFDAAGRRPRARVESRDVAVVRQGTSVAWARADGRIEIVSLRDGSIEQTLPGPVTRAPSLTTDPKGERLVAGGNRLTVWDLEGQRPLLEVPGPHVFALSSDGKRIAYAADGGTRVTVYDLDRQHALRGLDAGAEVSALALSADGSLVGAALRRQGTEASFTLRVMNVATGKITTLGQGGDGLVFSRTTPPQLTAYDSRRADVWDLATRRSRPLPDPCAWGGHHADTGGVYCSRVLRSRDAVVGAVALAAKVPRLATLYGDQPDVRLRVLDLDGAKSLLDVPVGPMTAVALSPDGRKVALGGAHGGELRDASTGQALVPFAIPSPGDEGTEEDEVALSFRPDGAALAVNRGLVSASIIEPTTGAVIQQLSGAQALTFSPASTLVAYYAEEEDVVRLADARTGEVRREFSPLERGAWRRVLAFSHDSGRLLAGTLRSLRWHALAPGAAPEHVWSGAAGDDLDGLAVLASGTIAMSSNGMVHFIASGAPARHLASRRQRKSRLQANELGHLVAFDARRVVLLHEATPGNHVELAVTLDHALVARNADGEVELLDPAARDGLLCQVGLIYHPIELCEDELLRTGLLTRAAAGASAAPRN